MSCAARVNGQQTLAAWTGAPLGQAVALASLRGHPVVLNIREASCTPCQSEAPLLEAAYAQYQPKGVRFIGATAVPTICAR